MPKRKLFWILMSIFQIGFGFVVFIATRNVYIDDVRRPGDRLSDIAPFASTDSSQTLDLNPALLRSLIEMKPDTQDPAAISLLANKYFEDKQYAEAAELYEQLLTFGPNNADVHNNLVFNFENGMPVQGDYVEVEDKDADGYADSVEIED